MKNCFFFGLLFLFISSKIFAGTYGGGSGSSGDPYLISTASHLYELYGTSGDWASYFKQTADITVSGTWTPIGNSTTKFTGSYNGQGYLVSGVSRDDVSSIGYWGFFGYTIGATIENLGVSVSLNCRTEVGGLIGYAQTTTITSCYTTGSVSGYFGYIGGLIGTSSGATISTCYSTATVTGGSSGSGSYTGGLVGRCINSSPVSNSYHITNNVSGRDYVGGLVGGLESSSSVSQCYSSGSVSGTSIVGGLIGTLSASVYDSYSRASVSNSGSTSGGLVGQNSSGSIDNCYSAGSVSGNGSNEGGLLGSNSGGTISDSFWDTETSGEGSSSGGTGKTTVQMKTASTFTDAGWSSSIWNIDASYNDGYPHLDWQNTGGTPLPVELTSFVAVVSNNDVTLLWQTASEVDNYGFEIQRAIFDDHFIDIWENVGFVEGNGNSNSPKDYSFTDKFVNVGKYAYRLKQIDNNGSIEYSPSVNAEVLPPKDFSLSQNFPNPFNPSTTIKFTIPNVEPLSASTSFSNHATSLRLVTLKVFDILGKEIATLVNEEKMPGVYNYQLSIDNYQLQSGIYFYELKSGKFTSRKKMLVLK